jgi:hypothetical protein
MSERTAPPPALRPRPVTRLSLLRWVGTCVLLLAALGAVAFGAVTGLRWAALDDESRAMLALMSEPRPPAAGHSGYPYLLLGDKDVPVETIAAVFAAREPGVDYAASNLPGLPRRPNLDNAQLCPAKECMQFVRENSDAVRTLLAANEARLAATDRALAAPHLRNPYPEGPSQPLPAWQNVRLALMAA